MLLDVHNDVPMGHWIYLKNKAQLVNGAADRDNDHSNEGKWGGGEKTHITYMGV
jgi:hypothetical protein